MVYVWGAEAEVVEKLLAALAATGEIMPLRQGRAVEMMGRDGRFMARAEHIVGDRHDAQASSAPSGR